MDQRPTKKQRELLNFIDGFIKGNGYGPSYREIMRALDYKSVSTVATHVNGLIARGWLLKKDNSARTLEVISPDSPIEMRTGLVQSSVEKELLQKIDSLYADDEKAHEHEIKVLREALVILGYRPARDTDIA